MAKIPVGYDDDGQTLNDGDDFYIDDWMDGSCGDLVENVGWMEGTITVTTHDDRSRLFLCT